jgi:hypothetical protein
VPGMRRHNSNRRLAIVERALAGRGLTWDALGSAILEAAEPVAADAGRAQAERLVRSADLAGGSPANQIPNCGSPATRRARP